MAHTALSTALPERNNTMARATSKQSRMKMRRKIKRTKKLKALKLRIKELKKAK